MEKPNGSNQLDRITEGLKKLRQNIDELHKQLNGIIGRLDRIEKSIAESTRFSHIALYVAFGVAGIGWGLNIIHTSADIRIHGLPVQPFGGVLVFLSILLVFISRASVFKEEYNQNLIRAGTVISVVGFILLTMCQLNIVCAYTILPSLSLVITGISIIVIALFTKKRYQK